MSSDRIKAAIERMNRGVGVMEARAEAGAFDRAEDRRKRQERREKDLRDRAREAASECERVTGELQALELRHAEVVGAHDALAARLEASAGQPGIDPGEAASGVDKERFDHLKVTHKALKRKYEMLCESAKNAVERLDEMIAAGSEFEESKGNPDG